MAKASIPVDLRNPGQVFACLGFLEAADVLLGDAEGGFDWNEPDGVKFVLRAQGDEDPVRRTLTFLAGAQAEEIVPAEIALGREDKPKERAVRLRNGNEELRLSHWADGSSREDFKQFAGRQSTSSILKARLAEIRNLIESNTALSTDPFKVVTPVRKGESTFMFDARAAWTVRDLGYSRDELQFAITASPLVEVLGPAGFEHARPKVDGLSVAYSAWEVLLSPALARVVVGTSDAGIRLRTFRFVRNATGKNGEYKQVTFAKEEMEAARG